MSTKAHTNKQKYVLGTVFGVVAAFIWSGFPVITKLGTEQTLTPYDITALRFAVAGTILLPWLWQHGLGGIG